jgi:hypothetical protein
MAAAAATTASGSLTLAYQTSTQVTSYGGTVYMPTLAEGDLIIVAQSAASSSSEPTPAYGTGFTSITTALSINFAAEDSWNLRGCLSYKIAGPSDSGAGITGFMNGFTEEAAVVVYRPSVAITTVTVQDISQQGTGGNPSSSTMSASASTKVTVCCAGCAYIPMGTAAVGNQSMTFTPTEDVAKTGPTFKTVVQDPTATDAVADAVDGGGSNVYFDCYLEVE